MNFQLGVHIIWAHGERTDRESAWERSSGRAYAGGIGAKALKLKALCLLGDQQIVLRCKKNFCAK